MATSLDNLDDDTAYDTLDAPRASIDAASGKKIGVRERLSESLTANAQEHACGRAKSEMEDDTRRNARAVLVVAS